MAHSLRRPLSLFTILRSAPYSTSISTSTSRRCFSQSPLLRALDRTQSARPRQSPDRSIRVASREMQKIPSDLGMLDNTFVTPTGSNVPNLFKTPVAFAQLQWKHLLYRLRDRFSLIVLWISSPKTGRRFWNRSIRLARATITPTAVALHRQMYTSFAEGDISALRKICSDGIYDSFRARIGNRQRGEKVVWELVKYNRGPKLVSHRGGKLPIEGAAIRQAVVKISSRQKLTRFVKAKNGELQVVPGSGKEKDVVEYMVVQTMAKDWREGAWIVWGTTTETTLNDIKEWDRRLME